jgi:hypothetical protein
VAHRQEGLALIELAACVEGADQRLAISAARRFEERIEDAVENLDRKSVV